MPSYRDRRGRFTTRTLWEELFRPTPAPPPEPEPEEEAPEDFEPNWVTNDVPYGAVWSTQYYDEHGKPHGDIEVLDEEALGGADFPEGFQAYKVIYSTIGDPAYPRGYKTSEPLYKTQWPPPSSDAMGADGIVAIRFF